MAHPRVLLVDDDTTLLAALVRTLTKACHLRVLVASSPDQALDYLSAAKFNLIVVDKTLPGISGTSLLALCIQSYPDMKRIVYSGDLALQEPLAHAVLFKGGPPTEAAKVICEWAYA
jgi:DNA-binding NtrC family response regulator